MWCAASLLVLAIFVVSGAFLLAPRIGPLLRSRILQTFRERFNSPATLDEIAIHFDGKFQVDARGLRVQSVLYGVPGDAAHPMLQVSEFHFRVGLLTAISDSPRIHHVRIRGVQLDLPATGSQVSHTPALTQEVDLEYAEVDDVHIRFAAGTPGRAPLTFDLPHLVFRGVSRSRPIRFHAVADAGPPVGSIEADGTVGPWNFDDPRQVPLQGTFAFRNKDMSSVPGLQGRLSMYGRFAGTVGQIETEAHADDPAFRLDVSSRTMPMRTNFRAALGAAAGVVTFHDLTGSFGETVFHLLGEAVKNRDPEGWQFDFLLHAPAARVEDVLALATRTPVPVLRGNAEILGKLHMRAGRERVARKLSFSDATVRITGATFGSANVQQTAEALASRARGEVKEAKQGDAQRMVATLTGPVSLRDEVLHFPALRILMPGAQADVHGVYSLGVQTFQFEGSVHTEAKVSHMTGGVKSLLLKPFNGFFSHGHKGATLPLYVNGAGDEPHFETRVAGMKMKAPAE